MEAPQEQKNEWWRHRLYDSEEAEELNEMTRKFWSEIKAEIPEAAYLSIKGSTIKGYANEDSDIDAYVVFDASHDPFREIRMKISHFVKDFENKNFKKLHIFIADLNKINDPYVNHQLAKDLLSPTLGEGDKYRAVIRHSIDELDEEDKEKWIDYVVDSAMYEHSPAKAIERGLIKPEDEAEYLEARRRLMTEKVKRFYI